MLQVKTKVPRFARDDNFERGYSELALYHADFGAVLSELHFVHELVD
jgi:hypothetical protein